MCSASAFKLINVILAKPEHFPQNCIIFVLFLTASNQATQTEDNHKDM